MDTSPASGPVLAVESKTYPLGGLDKWFSSFSIPLLLFFENNAAAAADCNEFMPFEVLRDALHTALQSVPILLGRMRRSRDTGFLEVAVDGDDLNMPVVREFACDATFGDARAARGAAVVLKLPHALVDVAGYISLLDRWTAECRRLAHGKPVPPELRQEANHDRGCLGSSLAGVGSDGSPGALGGPAALKSGALSRWFARRSPWAQGFAWRVASAVAPKPHGACYFVARSKLDELRLQIQEHLPRGHRVSDNDILIAFAGMVMAQSGSKAPGSLSGLLRPRPRAFVITTVADVRVRVSALSGAGYCGNGIVPLGIPIPPSQIYARAAPDTLAPVCAAIRRTVGAITPEHIASVLGALGTERDLHVRGMAYGTRYPHSMLLTSHTHVKYYQLDFGWGAPTYVSLIEGQMSGLVYLLPAHPSLDGYHVNFSAPRPALQRIRAANLWGDFASRVY
ncbi:hypothetical protein H4R18_001651 [Coemansia javaensis]|uniref:Uncharacterized protein n=1 Tax=Coemansia javaensis TaxID=2761396 RepID=A0A9W8LKA8_9FUNG|nr:hypothetical protein H4R18_001651 [Coemansia javaensis]